MPGQLVSVLSNLGHNVETVIQEGMAGHPDGDIWRRAQQEGSGFQRVFSEEMHSSVHP